jgi:hypothetical protein
MVPKMRFCRLLVPSAFSLITHAAMVCLCTSRPQQLRYTRIALSLCHRRRRLYWKNLPFELSAWRCHFMVPTASSSTCYAGSTTPLRLSELGRAVATLIVRSLATIFMLHCDRDSGHADLLPTVTIADMRTQPADSSLPVISEYEFHVSGLGNEHSFVVLFRGNAGCCARGIRPGSGKRR